jgi:signal transduction histidine kinase/methylmalonyl-CoA mutase cobalamin-binding subunit
MLQCIRAKRLTLRAIVDCLPPLGVAVVAVSITALVRWSLTAILGGESPLLLFILPILLVAANFGTLAGLFTTFIAAAVGAFMFVEPTWSLSLDAPQAVRLTVFVTEGIIISMLCGWLLAAKSAAINANDAKDQFISALSHELRTPLTPVVAAISELNAADNLTPEQKDMLRIAHRNVGIEVNLIDDLLDLSRIRAGKLVLKRVPIDLHGVIREALAVLQPSAQAKDASLTIRLEATRTAMFCDRSRLEQVLWNVVGNAIKFSPVGGSVLVSTSDAAGRVMIQVKDNGIGIAPELMPRLFRPFEQGEQVTRQLGGLGLGLAISHAIIEAHGGTLAGENLPPRGARFTINLPLSDLTVEKTEAPPPTAKSEPRRRVRILLVEDHKDTAHIMSRLLRSRGYSVDVAGGVEAAVAALSGDHYDVMLSDLGLPDGSGHDIMKRMNGTGIQAIALSGLGMDEDKQRSVAAGFAHHLTKPVNMDLLVHTIDAVVAAKTH